jgi:hypothetical protein
LDEEMTIEAIQNAVGGVLELWPIAAPTLIISAIFCWWFRSAPWIAPIWVFFACPVIVFFGLLGRMVIVTQGGSGPDWGFVGMGTAFILLGSLPLIIPGVGLLCAFPRKIAVLRPIVACGCLVSAAASVGGIYYGVRLATVVPNNEASATMFAESYLRSTSGGVRRGFRHSVFEAMIWNPKTPSATLVKIGLGLDAHSPLWRDLAQNPSLPREVIDARISNATIAEELVTFSKVPPEYLAKLADSKDVRMRASVASTNCTPKNILEKLAQDNDKWVRDCANSTLRSIKYSKTR